jgi:hypothetical protein
MGRSDASVATAEVASKPKEKRMLDEQSFKQMEELLGDAHDLMGRIHEENALWPGIGVFERDIEDAKALLQDMQQAVSDLIVAVAETLGDSADPEQEIETTKAVDKEYSLINRLYNDVRRAHEALKEDRSQTEAIKQTEMHLKQFTAHSRQARDRLLELARVTRVKSG